MAEYTRTKLTTMEEEEPILYGMILSDQALDSIAPMCNPQYFTSNYAQKVARWILDFHKENNRAPKKHITDIFNEEKRNGRDVELVGEFLKRLSDRYDPDNPDDQPIPEYVAKQAETYFRKRAYEILAESLQGPSQEEALEKFVLPTLSKNFVEGITLIEGMTKPKKKEKYLVDKFLTIPSFNALGARMKSGKSNIFYNLILNKLTGGQFLNEFHIADDNDKILLLDLENNFNQCLGEIRKVMRAQNLMDTWQEWGDRLIIQSRESWPIMSKDGVPLLKKIIKENPDIKLIIIDTWKLFNAPRSDKAQFSYDKDYAEVNLVKNIAIENSLCVLTSVHLNKSYKLNAESPMDSFYGSTGFPSACDGLFALVPSTGKADMILHGQGRYIANIKIALEKDIEKRSWRYLGESDVYEMSEKHADVYCALQDATEPKSPKELSLLLGEKTGSIDQILLKMLRQGRIKKAGYGKYQVNL